MLTILKHALVSIMDVLVLSSVAGWVIELSQQTFHLSGQISLILGMTAAVIAFGHLKFRHILQGVLHG